MKEPWEWEESDILSLIENRVPESLNLEFKSCDALTKDRWRPELVKDISAFANSAGGTTLAFSCGARSASELKEKGYLKNMLSRRQLQGLLGLVQYEASSIPATPC